MYDLDVQFVTRSFKFDPNESASQHGGLCVCVCEGHKARSVVNEMWPRIKI